MRAPVDNLNEPISINPEAVISSLEKTVGQQAGMLARYESVIEQLQQRITALAAKVPAEDDADA
jgi:hypothetical protein